jgi:hypothetical protein
MKRLALLFSIIVIGLGASMFAQASQSKEQSLEVYLCGPTFGTRIPSSSDAVFNISRGDNSRTVCTTVETAD